MPPRLTLLSRLAVGALKAISFLPGLTFALGALALAPQPAATLSIDALGNGTAKLSGWWQFHLGDDLTYAQPTLDDSAGHGGWEQISADTTWGRQSHPAYTGFAWYRRHLRVTIAPGVTAGGVTELALFLPPIEDAYEIYWNGTLIGSRGRFPPHPLFYFAPPSHTFGLDNTGAGAAGLTQTAASVEGVLAFRVWKAPLVSFDSESLGGFTGTPEIGSATAIAARQAQADYAWLRGRQYMILITFTYLLVMLVSLLFWLRARSQKLLFWMAVYCFAYCAAILLLSLRVPFPFYFAMGCYQPVFALQDVSLWFVLLYILKLDRNPRLHRFTYILAWITLLSGVLDGLLITITNPALTWQAQFGDAVLTGITSLTEFFPLVLVVMGLRRRGLDASRWLVAIFAFTAGMLSVLRIVLQQGERFTHWTIAQYVGAPLFNILGNNLNAEAMSRTLLLFAILYAVYGYTREASRRQSALETEFRNARELQQILIPETIPPIDGYTITSAYKPAQEVGGDFFQIIPIESDAETRREGLSDGRLGRSLEAESPDTLIVIGDVSGKGLKAAMTVSLIVGAVRSLAPLTPQPAALLEQVNARLHGRLQGGFATCLALLLSTDGSCTMASAGHPAPFLNQRELELPGALPLGLAASASYPEITFKLRENDHLSLYTDGLLEARSPSGELYGFERLNVLFSSNPTASEAFEAAANFGQDDDITILTLTRLSRGQNPTITLYTLTA